MVVDVAPSTPIDSRRFIFDMPEVQARRLHSLIDAEIASYKNHIVSRVSAGDFKKAQEYAHEVDCLRALYAAFNISAKYEIHTLSQKPLQTEIRVDYQKD